MTGSKKKTPESFQLLVVVRYKAEKLFNSPSVSVAIHSTIASFPTKLEADIAFENVKELVNASGEYAVTKLYL